MPIRLADEIWKGRRAFIIGGGPSLKTLPPGFMDMLRGELTIGINMAHLFNPTIVFSEDVDFQKRAVESLDFALCDSVKIFQHVLPERMSLEWPGIITLGHCGRRWSRTLADGLVLPSCSGVAALNLAELLGADPIYLIGFDLQEKGGRTVNWHDHYARHGRDSCYGRFKADFERYAPKIRADVYNLNPDSALECFPKVRPEIIFPTRFPRVMSFATPAYEEEAQGLLESSKLFGFDVDLHRIEDQGSWKANVRQKPVEILKALSADGDPAVLYVDADARFIRFPGLFDPIPADFAAHLFETNRREQKLQVCGGTLYFGGGRSSRELVRHWINNLDRTQSDPTGDQDALSLALKAALDIDDATLHEWAQTPGPKYHKGAFRFYNLPPEYVWISGTMSARYPGRFPTILHRQMSRVMNEEGGR